jgi:hypothetical protein
VTALRQCAFPAVAATKPFSGPAKYCRNQTGLGSAFQTMGFVMLALILNAIYRHFIRTSISGARIAGG